MINTTDTKAPQHQHLLTVLARDGVYQGKAVQDQLKICWICEFPRKNHSCAVKISISYQMATEITENKKVFVLWKVGHFCSTDFFLELNSEHPWNVLSTVENQGFLVSRLFK